MIFESRFTPDAVTEQSHDSRTDRLVLTLTFYPRASLTCLLLKSMNKGNEPVICQSNLLAEKQEACVRSANHRKGREGVMDLSSRRTHYAGASAGSCFWKGKSFRAFTITQPAITSALFHHNWLVSNYLFPWSSGITIGNPFLLLPDMITPDDSIIVLMMAGSCVPRNPAPGAEPFALSLLAHIHAT